MLWGTKYSCFVALKSKLCVEKNYLNLEKRMPFYQFASKLFVFFFVKDLTNRVLFSSDHNFWEHIILARLHCKKMNDHFPNMTKSVTKMKCLPHVGISRNFL